MYPRVKLSPEEIILDFVRVNHCQRENQLSKVIRLKIHVIPADSGDVWVGDNRVTNAQVGTSGHISPSRPSGRYLPTLSHVAQITMGGQT